MALSADVCGIYLLKPDRLWNVRREAFFQIFGIYSSNILEFIPVIWNFGLVWVMFSAVVSNAGFLRRLTQLLSGAVSNAGFLRRLTQLLLWLCQMQQNKGF